MFTGMYVFKGVRFILLANSREMEKWRGGRREVKNQTRRKYFDIKIKCLQLERGWGSEMIYYNNKNNKD